jgi:chromosome segregation ATPase
MQIKAARVLISILAGASILACALPHAAHAAEDTTARLREVLHRTQEALHQAQSDNAELTRAKTDAEQKLQTATKELEAARGVSKAEVALRGQLQTSKAAEDDLTHKWSDATAALASASLKQGETEKQLLSRDAELAQVKQGLELSKTATASCENKNLKLYSYAQEVLHAYRKKGVWAALSQKDPVFGLKDVDVQNVVQEYQLKFASQRVKP